MSTHRERRVRRPMSRYASLSTASIQAWLANHRACIEAGMNIGEIDRAKARAFTLELLHRAKAAR
ncbi:MAG TPA: hypothetical protein VFT75_18565 [Nocardioidaceae bacterium]|nr:hypothetical protein [Nocardioidaceae bacterium]